MCSFGEKGLLSHSDLRILTWKWYRHTNIWVGSAGHLVLPSSVTEFIKVCRKNQLAFPQIVYIPCPNLDARDENFTKRS